MLRFFQIALFYLLLVWLALLLLVGNAACLPLLCTPKSLRQPLVQKLISAVFRLFLQSAVACGLMKLDLCSLDTLNDQNKLILVANHPSMIDVFLIISRVKNSLCLMKASIGSNIFLGVGAYLAGYVSNRSTDGMIRCATLAVGQGNLLLVFPEGTRTTQQPVNDFKASAALIAKRAQAPLQTIFILTNSAYLSKGWKIWRPPQFPLVYKASLGKLLSAGPSSVETAQRMHAYFAQTIARSIDPGLEL